MVQFLRRLPLFFLIFSAACAAPINTSTSHDHEVARVATLLAEEMQHQFHPWHSRKWHSAKFKREESFNLFDLSRHIILLSHSYEVDPLLVLAIMKVESQFCPQARSHAGAVGLMQVMPIVLREVGDEISIQRREELLDPYKNVHIGIHYFTFLLDKYQHDVEKALIAYNIGPTALDSYLNRQGSPSLRYCRKVMQYYREFQAKALVFPQIT